MPTQPSLMEAYSMGDVVAEFKFRTDRFNNGFIVGLLIIGGLFACAGGWVLASSTDRTAMIVLVVGIGIVVFAVAFAAYTSAIRRNERVLVCEHGLVDLRRKKATVIRWEDMVGVRQAAIPEQQFLFAPVGPFPLPIPIGVEHHFFCYVLGRFGDRLEYRDDTVVNVRQLGLIIQDQTTRRLWPGALETFEKGGTVDFCTLSLSRQGVTRDTETLPWSDIAAISFKRGQIIIQKEGESKSWARVYIGHTNNIFVFVGLVKRMARPVSGPQQEAGSTQNWPKTDRRLRSTENSVHVDRRDEFTI